MHGKTDLLSNYFFMDTHLMNWAISCSSHSHRMTWRVLNGSSLPFHPAAHLTLTSPSGSQGEACPPLHVGHSTWEGIWGHWSPNLCDWSSTCWYGTGAEGNIQISGSSGLTRYISLCIRWCWLLLQLLVNFHKQDEWWALIKICEHYWNTSWHLMKNIWVSNTGSLLYCLSTFTTHAVTQ